MSTLEQALGGPVIETIAGMAHDIKTPLTSILAFIDLIREQTPKDSESCRKRIAR